MVWLIVVALIYATAVSCCLEFLHDLFLVLVVLKVEYSEVSFLLHVDVDCRVRTSILVRTSVCTSVWSACRHVLLLEEIE